MEGCSRWVVIITHCYIMFIPHRAISAQMAQQDDVFCTLFTFACQCDLIFCKSICHLRNGGDLMSGWMQYRGISRTIMAYLHHVHPRPLTDLTTAATTRASDRTRHVAPPHLTLPRKVRQAARDIL